jgi:exodeoxyribonuclease VII large subunit
MIETPAKQQIYTVSALNREARMLIDGSFPLLWVEGEISNLRQPSSGHLYFGLKDATAQIRCAMFRMRSQSLTFTPKDGMQVLVRCKASLYEERGEFQLIVESMEEAGDGALRRAFEALKKRLAEEGLFDAARKKLIPKMPKCVGVVTSATGAAIRDILSVLKRRFPSLPVIIYPTQVQGSEAAGQIVRALKWANERKECDVLILTRGGGSLEDLWPFNEEIVARAIFSSEIPIVSGIGHEIDFTIADFVADQRAATPSAAAELVSPDVSEYLQSIKHWQSRLKQLMLTYMRHTQMTLTHLTQRLQHPGQRLQEQAQRLDNVEQRLAAAMNYRLQNTQQKLANLSRALGAVSPLNTLSRGYAIVSKADRIESSVKNIQRGDHVNIRLIDGLLNCLVDEIQQN